MSGLKAEQTGSGVWIDSRTALIASVEDDGERSGEVRRITTDLEKQLRLSSGERGATSQGPQEAPSDDMRQTSSMNNLHVFLDEVVAAVRDSRRIYVFGPGEAKLELKKRLERGGLSARVEGMDCVGRLSERQVAAKARGHFRPQAASAPQSRSSEGGLEMRNEKSRAEPHHDGRPTPELRSVMRGRLETEYVAGPAADDVDVDFPKSGEAVKSRDYAIRVSARSGGIVEVSIDDGAWRPCREAAGHWWYDWSGYRAGPHTLFARATLHRRRRVISARRDFHVDAA